jgi:glycosyltransferase involved in cell wall biosynthesis
MPPPDDSQLISILVPVFNESRTVAAVIDRLRTIPLPAPREIIVVDDGSSDDTGEIVERLAARVPDMRVIRSPRNHGKGHAVRTALQTATGTVIAIQDADLELDPAQLAELVEPVLSGEAAVVYGSRFLDGRPDAPWLTVFANQVLTEITNTLYGSSLTDMETCYKIMRGDVARALVLESNRFDIEPEITAKLLRAGHRIVERSVRFQARGRAAGKKMRWRDGIDAVRVLVRHRLRTAP